MLKDFYHTSPMDVEPGDELQAAIGDLLPVVALRRLT